MKLNKIRKLHKIQKIVAEPKETQSDDEGLEIEAVPVVRTPLKLLAANPMIEDVDIEIMIEDETEVPEHLPEVSGNDQEPQQAPKNGMQAPKDKVKHPPKHPAQNSTGYLQNFPGAQLVAEIALPVKVGPTKAQISKKLLEIKKNVAFVNSIIEPVQTLELKNHMIGKLARVFCMYRVNEIVVYNDEAFAKDKRANGFDPSEFIVKILQYLETPQYLRKRLFPISALLRNVGLLTPLECLHHLKVEDMFEYREGVILKRPTRENEGSWVDIGLLRVE